MRPRGVRPRLRQPAGNDDTPPPGSAASLCSVNSSPAPSVTTVTPQGCSAGWLPNSVNVTFRASGCGVLSASPRVSACAYIIRHESHGPLATYRCPTPGADPQPAPTSRRHERARDHDGRGAGRIGLGTEGPYAAGIDEQRLFIDRPVPGSLDAGCRYG